MMLIMNDLWIKVKDNHKCYRILIMTYGQSTVNKIHWYKIIIQITIQQSIMCNLNLNTLSDNNTSTLHQAIMDRSQVRQFGLNRSIYSSKVMGMSSSILHSPRSNTQRQIHLRKSRIANIPDSKNIDLSDKLDFVVVFQTIEIQRMAEQIQTARSRIKQYERQLFNCDNYEVQIKELTQKCYRLQSEKNSYREELYENKRASDLIFNQLEQIKKRYVTVDFTTNEKYKLEKGRNDQLLLQVEKWKSRYNALDQSKSKQLQTIKKMMEEQSKSHLSRETKQLFDRFQLEKQEMEQMIRSLKQMNLQKETELKKCKFQLQSKDKLMDEIERQVDEYEEKVALLSQEHYRLSEMNKTKQNQITKLKDKLKDSQQLTNKLNQELIGKSQEVKRLMLKLKKLQENTSEKQLKLTKLQKLALTDKERLSQLDRIVFLLKERQNQIQSKNKIIQRKDKKLISLQEQIKKLQQHKTTTKHQVTTLKQHTQLTTQTIQQLLQRIQLLSSILQKAKHKTQTSNSQLQTHNASLTSQIHKKTQQLTAYSQKLMSELHQSEDYINKLQDIIKSNTQKINVMEIQKIEVLEKLEELREYEVEYDRVEQENNSLKSKVQKILEENDKLLEHNRNLQQQKQQLSEEKNSLVKQKNALVKEKNNLMRQKDNLIEQTEMKQSQIMNQTQRQIQIIQENYQNNILKNIQHQLSVKNKQLTNKHKELMSKDKELMCKDKQLMSKDKEVNQLKVTIANLDKNYTDKERQFTNKQQQLKSMFQSKEKQFNIKQNSLTKQLQQKSQLLIKSQKLSNQLNLSTDQLTKYYQSTVKLQIQSLITRIQPIQTAINTIKHIVTEKLIKQQNAYLQKQQQHQKHISELIDINTLLIQKNNQLYQSIISSNNIDLKSIDTIPLNSTNTTTTIYTSKPLSSPRNTNQNYNTSNLIGMGTRIKQTIKANFNNQTSSSIPIEFLIKHSLRQRIGDKNAKVQKMKNSLMVSNVSSNKSFVAVVNGNTRMANEQIHHQNDGDMMLQSNLMSSTLINKLNNPFLNSIVGNMNNETSFIHQSRLVETGGMIDRHNGQQVNIRRVISEERYPGVVSPDNSSIQDSSQHKNTGIYTNRMNGSGIGFGRNGFKSIGIKKAKIYN